MAPIVLPLLPQALCQGLFFSFQLVLLLGDGCKALTGAIGESVQAS
jgi:hypothetical protein